MSDTPIAELFARDPLKMTDEDIDKIISKYRENRQLFISGDKQAGSTKPRKQSEKAKNLEEAKKVAKPLDISDLL